MPLVTISLLACLTSPPDADTSPPEPVPDASHRLCCEADTDCGVSIYLEPEATWEAQACPDPAVWPGWAGGCWDRTDHYQQIDGYVCAVEASLCEIWTRPACDGVWVDLLVYL